jgi:hypothetical protein
VSRALGCSVLLVVLVASGCGSSTKSKRRDAVNSYLSRIEQIQNHYRQSFTLANQAYRDFSKGKAGKRQVDRLRGAEVSILAARNALETVTPPEDARKLHGQLLHLYDLNAALGLEVITLQQFLPGVKNVLARLGVVNSSYRKNLSGSKTADAQAGALDSYGAAVETVVARFRRLGPPPALRPWQQSQVTRLQQIVDTAHTLAKALRVRDRIATQALIKRFRFLLGHQPNVSGAEHNAVKAYDNRLVRLSKLQGKIAREHQRLQDVLG